MADNEKLYEAEFLQLVIGLHGSAWMLLGKVANPMTGEVERNLEAAKATIDTLGMLKVKTRGNLSKDEGDYLSNILQQLQLNYVDEVDKSKKEEQIEKEVEQAVETASQKEKKKDGKKVKEKKKKRSKK